MVPESAFWSCDKLRKHSQISNHSDYYLQLKLVGLLERVIVLERRVPELAERRKVEEIERSITTINQRLAQVQTSAGSGTGGPVTVPRYGTINDMAGICIIV